MHQCAGLALRVSRATAYRYASGGRIPHAVERLLAHEIDVCMVRCYGPGKYQGFREGRPMGPMVERSDLAYAFAMDL